MFCAVGALCMFSFFCNRVVSDREIAAYSAYDMFSWYKYLIVN